MSWVISQAADNDDKMQQQAVQHKATGVSSLF